VPKGTAGAKKKSKRTALPGGAPVRSRSKKAKPPCKYGPRGADGYCPKKPKSAKSTKANPTRVTARTTDAAVEQGIKVLANPRASSSQKAEAAQTVATTIATDAARKTVRRQSGPIREAIKKHGTTVAGVAIPIYIALKAAQQIPKQRLKEALAFADRELAKTKKALGAQWRDDQAEVLHKQYFDFAMKRPVTNTFLGK
jgi:hypothetical protein